MEKVKCKYMNECYSYQNKPRMCKTCKNNSLRNYITDYYVSANDNKPPAECPKLSFIGTAEQTMGYKCPVCGEYTNPYRVRENRCEHCGYILNIE